jgi:hypothetical protein
LKLRTILRRITGKSNNNVDMDASQTVSQTHWLAVVVAAIVIATSLAMFIGPTASFSG